MDLAAVAAYDFFVHSGALALSTGYDSEDQPDAEDGRSWATFRVSDLGIIPKMISTRVTVRKGSTSLDASQQVSKYASVKRVQGRGKTQTAGDFANRIAEYMTSSSRNISCEA